MTDLFSPLKLGRYELPNRIFMAPMTRNRAPDNIANAMMAFHYRQRASAGLLITEGSQISEQAVGYPATPGIYSPEQVEGWRGVVDAVHADGGHIFLQLWHCGRVSHPDYHGGEPAVAPSAIRPAGEAFTNTGLKPFEMPRELTLSEISDVVDDYKKATGNAIDAGFDGVEIHGANGYLLDQFLRDGSNQRSDAYGGTLKNRARLMLEVTEAVCDVAGAERVGIRLSPLQPFNDMRDSNPEETFSYVVEQLNHFGLAYLHVTEMGSEVPDAAGPAFDLGRLRLLWRGLYITNSGYDKARGNAAIMDGNADAVAFGQPYIANPDLVERLRSDAELNVPDGATFYGGDEHGYTDYPAMGGV
ncbi:MAG: alkene reductase [Mariprofundaceae bacterium]|nr:alkene reductase [Mariprofundaceae bacterium]